MFNLNYNLKLQEMNIIEAHQVELKKSIKVAYIGIISKMESKDVVSLHNAYCVNNNLNWRHLIYENNVDSFEQLFSSVKKLALTILASREYDSSCKWFYFDDSGKLISLKSVDVATEFVKTDDIIIDLIARPELYSHININT